MAVVDGPFFGVIHSWWCIFYYVVQYRSKVAGSTEGLPADYSKLFRILIMASLRF